MNRDKTVMMRVGSARFLALWFCVSSALRLAFAKLLVPPLIQSAYRGESVAFLNNIFAGRSAHGLRYYLEVWDRVSLPGLVAYLVFWAVVLVMSRPAFFRRCVGEATPGSLGAIRMWTCTILLFATLSEDFARLAHLPAQTNQ